MKVGCQRFSREMADFTARLNLHQGNQNSEEKLELLKMFVEYLESDKHGMRKHGRGRHGMFGRFGKHGYGRHHGRHSPYGHHGHHHGRHGSRHHHHHHGHGLHGHHGKFKPHWIIDLTQDHDDTQATADVQNELIAVNNESASIPNTQVQIGVSDCEYAEGQRHCHRTIYWRPCHHKRNIKDNFCQTDEIVIQENTEQPQDNLSAMVENINIENTE